MKSRISRVWTASRSGEKSIPCSGIRTGSCYRQITFTGKWARVRSYMKLWYGLKTSKIELTTNLKGAKI